MQTLGQSAGYQVLTHEGAVLFVNRKTFVPGLATWLLGGLGAMMSMHAVVFSALGQWQMGVVFGPIAVLLIYAATRTHRVYRRCLTCPPLDCAYLRADLAAGTLCDKDGRQLASLGDVSVTTRFNRGNTLQGVMKHVVLRWPGGKAVLYNANWRAANEMARTIEQQLAPSPVDRTGLAQTDGDGGAKRAP